MTKVDIVEAIYEKVGAHLREGRVFKKRGRQNCGVYL